MNALPPFARAALLLDLDGTLLDFAPTPDQVVVPLGLPASLARLRDTLGGALAVITGRPVAQIDALLPDLVPAVAGEHGGALRPSPGAGLLRPELPVLPSGLLAAVEAVAVTHPGVVVEHKPHGVVLHYRMAEAAGPALLAALLPIVGGFDRFQLVAAHFAWEVRPRGIDKGGAVRAVMALPAFAGRLPVFIGDDVTDEDGLAAARQLGGVGLFVPDVFGSPGAVRDWLKQSRTDWAAFPAML